MLAKKKSAWLQLILALFICYLPQVVSSESIEENKTTINLKDFKHTVVEKCKKIKIDGFKNAYNPSILLYKGNILLAFRVVDTYPNKNTFSSIGVILLDKDFNAMTHPQILKIPSTVTNQLANAEDPRIAYINDRIILVFNEHWYQKNIPMNAMRMCELIDMNGDFICGEVIGLEPPFEDRHLTRQKNWVPFDYQGTLALSYIIDPHYVIFPDLLSGECCDSTQSMRSTHWKWGKIRGGTPATLYNGEYLAFFHSSLMTKSILSGIKPKYHYFMGAYTYSKEPPFHVTKISPYPIYSDRMYKRDRVLKKFVVFPGGYFIDRQSVYLAYGKNDNSMYIAKISLSKLMKSLVDVDHGQTVP